MARWKLPEGLPFLAQAEFHEALGQIGMRRAAQHRNRIGIDRASARRIDVTHAALVARFAQRLRLEAPVKVDAHAHRGIAEDR